MKVLAACEFSGRVRDAFRAKGHEAWSCDIVDSEVWGPHIVQDCMEVIQEHSWDLIIACPPCTYLSCAGNMKYSEDKPEHHKRLEAIEWTMKLWWTMKRAVPLVAMENPPGCLPMPPTQYIEPHEFGHPWTKKTGLWLSGLPLLRPTEAVEPEYSLTQKERDSRVRSMTPLGLAEAMADQWGSLTVDWKPLV